MFDIIRFIITIYYIKKELCFMFKFKFKLLKSFTAVCVSAIFMLTYLNVVYANGENEFKAESVLDNNHNEDEDIDNDYLRYIRNVKVKPQTDYYFIKNFFSEHGGEDYSFNNLCLQFVFEKNEPGIGSFSFAAISVATNLLMADILKGSKERFVRENLEYSFHKPFCSIGGLFVDYPIYVKDKNAKARLINILNSEYFKKGMFKKHIKNVISNVNENSGHLKLEVDRHIKAINKAIKTYKKNIEKLNNAGKSNESCFDYGKKYLDSIILSCRNDCYLTEEYDSFYLEKLVNYVDQVLKNRKKVTEIGKYHIKDAKKYFKDSIKYLKEIYLKDLENGFKVYIDDNGKEFSVKFKDVVSFHLKNMKQTPNGIVSYNGFERYILRKRLK